MQVQLKQNCGKLFIQKVIIIIVIQDIQNVQDVSNFKNYIKKQYLLQYRF